VPYTPTTAGRDVQLTIQRNDIICVALATSYYISMQLHLARQRPNKTEIDRDAFVGSCYLVKLSCCYKLCWDRVVFRNEFRALAAVATSIMSSCDNGMALALFFWEKYMLQNLPSVVYYPLNSYL
jgi:hypothetical protein